MNKKNIFIFTCIIFLFISLSCSNSKDDKKVDKIIVKYARETDVTPALKNIIKTFNNIQHEIEVQVVEVMGDTNEKHDKYLTKFIMKSSDYDIIDGDIIWIAEFAHAGHILPLDKYIKRDKVDLTNYLDGSKKAVMYKGQVWGIQRYIDAGVLYYRTDIVKKPPKTWNQLVTMAKKYKGQKGTKYGFVLQASKYEGLVCNVVEYIHSYGGRIVDQNGKIVINSSGSFKGLTKFIQIIDSDFVPGDILKYKESESEKAFTSGQAVFLRNWPYVWSIARGDVPVKGKVGIAPLPRGDSRSSACIGGWVVMLNKYSKNPDAAWEFLKFVSGPQGQKIRAVHGSLPPTYVPLYKDQEVLTANPFLKEGYLEVVKEALPRPVSPVYSQLSEIIQTEVTKILNKEISVKQALINMDQKMKEVIKGI